MRVVEVIPARRWRNRDGRTASIYGAVPAGEGWEIEVVGWTWRTSEGTIGLCRRPVATKAEAERVARAFNQR